MTTIDILLYYGIPVATFVLGFWFWVQYVYYWSKQDRNKMVKRIEKTLIIIILICVVIPIISLAIMLIIQSF